MERRLLHGERRCDLPWQQEVKRPDPRCTNCGGPRSGPEAMICRYCGFPCAPEPPQQQLAIRPALPPALPSPTRRRGPIGPQHFLVGLGLMAIAVSAFWGGWLLVFSGLWVAGVGLAGFGPNWNLVGMVLFYACVSTSRHPWFAPSCCGLADWLADSRKKDFA